ncbi:UbiA family prenyltransferase [Leptotrichia hofstadii]|uniref:Uncharacterized protein n=1 Tax=Leptotrichia hofstadii F0254 TaxID=634994 RepID=C9MWR9_9FUSO|nr:UbiA family prenyltransferase [Leptotrichia hofstadii]EEX74935.1 hypothetical protein GCWU000323_00990 [Leptotrichia hofstadii F0254]
MNRSNINSKKSIIQNIKNFKIYLNERFPLGKNSFFVLIFTLSGYIYTSLLYNSKIITPILSKEVNRVSLLWDKEIDKVPMIWYKLLPLFIIIFMFFFQLRITDEFKDYEEDLKYRSYRPVQRGVISLKTLRKIGIATVIVQIILAHVINPKLIYFMLLVWIYMFLMTKEFFYKELAHRKNFNLCFLPCCNNDIYYPCYCKRNRIYFTESFFRNFVLITKKI